ncbi:MAG TPA: hypothetical protein VF710_16120 [Longimicrobium sp.]|jgi:hypothetical protein
MAPVLLTLAGGIAGVLSAIYSAFLAGAGHGWTSALPFGLASLLLFPLGYRRLAHCRSASSAASWAWFAVAVCLDVALFAMTLAEGSEYFARVWEFAIPWILLWGTWQLAATAPILINLLDRGRRTPGI